MTRRFFCALYFKDHNEVDVRSNGINPLAIWEILHYKAFDESLTRQIVDRLIANNLNTGLIEFDSQADMVSVTEEGRRWGGLNCARVSGVT